MRRKIIGRGRGDESGCAGESVPAYSGLEIYVKSEYLTEHYTLHLLLLLYYYNSVFLLHNPTASAKYALHRLVPVETLI